MESWVNFNKNDLTQMFNSWQSRDLKPRPCTLPLNEPWNKINSHKCSMLGRDGAWNRDLVLYHCTNHEIKSTHTNVQCLAETGLETETPYILFRVTHFFYLGWVSYLRLIFYWVWVFRLALLFNLTVIQRILFTK